MGKQTKKYIVYAITVGISAVLVLFLMSVNGFFGSDDLSVKYKALADAFTVPGALLLMAGALALIGSTGFFDALSYALAGFAKALIPGGRIESNGSFYDYKRARAEKRKGGFIFFLASGAFFVAFSILFTILFYTV